jgi:hypothetical protein
MVRHAAERELRDQMIHPGQATEFRDLLDTIIRRADDLDTQVEIRRLRPEISSFIFV